MNATELSTSFNGPQRDGRALSARHQPRAWSPSLLTFLEPFFARKMTIIFTLLATMLLGWLALLIWPRVYESEAKLLIRVGRESVSLDPTATTSQTMLLQKTQEEEVNSALEVMYSRHLSELVVDRLGSGPILDGYLPGDEGKDSNWLSDKLDSVMDVVSDGLYTVLVATGIKDELSDRELAIMDLQKTVNVYAPKKSTVLVVHANSKSPEMAQAIASAMIDCFLGEHLQNSQTEGSQDFFRKEVTQAEASLNRLLDRRIAMLQEKNIESTDSRRVTLMAAMSDIENSVRNSLNALELQEVNLTSSLTPSHPRLAKVIRELNDTRQVLESMQPDVAMQRDTSAAKPRAPREKYTLLLADTKAASAHRSRMEGKKSQFLALRSELRDLMQFKLQMDDLEREIGQAFSSHEKLVGKLEEARVIDELQDRQISNLSVVQPANFIERAISPNKKLLVAGFTMLGLMGGLGLVVLREVTSKAIRTLDQLRAQEYPAHGIAMPAISALRNLESKNSDSRRGKIARTPELQLLLSEVMATVGNQHGLAVGVIGVANDCGASSLALGISLAAEQEGIETTLVDTDLKRQTVSRIFSCSKSPGVADILHDGHEITDCIQMVPRSTLQVVSAASTASPRRRQFNDTSSVDFLSWLRDKNDLVVIDFPALGSTKQAIDVSLVDSMIVVIESGETSSDDLDRLLQRLDSLDVHVSAIVLNKTSRTVPALLETVLS